MSISSAGSPGAPGFSGERAEAGYPITTKYRELHEGSVIPQGSKWIWKKKEGQQQLQSQTLALASNAYTFTLVQGGYTQKADSPQKQGSSP